METSEGKTYKATIRLQAEITLNIHANDVIEAKQTAIKYGKTYYHNKSQYLSGDRLDFTLQPVISVRDPKTGSTHISQI